MHNHGLILSFGLKLSSETYLYKKIGVAALVMKIIFMYLGKCVIQLQLCDLKDRILFDADVKKCKLLLVKFFVCTMQADTVKFYPSYCQLL